MLCLWSMAYCHASKHGNIPGLPCSPQNQFSRVTCYSTCLLRNTLDILKCAKYLCVFVCVFINWFIDVLLGTHSLYQCPFDYWFILQELLIFHVYWFLNYNICILVQTICNQLDIQEKLNVYIQQELFYNHVLRYLKLQSSKFC